MDKIKSKFHHILRVYIPNYAFKSRVEDILNYCRRTKCSEVLLFTTSYDLEPSFNPIKSIIKYTNETLKPAASLLREAGIVVSINVMQTLGHIYFPNAMGVEFPFQRRVYRDGTISTEGACPMCSKLHDWVYDSYRVYSEIRPHVIFVDDDFRTSMQNVSCFCKFHLDEIGKRFGKPVTREDVVDAIYSDAWPPSPLRKLYFEVTTDGYSHLSTIIRKAVKEISPETKIGVMTSVWPSNAIGIEWQKVLDKISGNGLPIVRPQISTYNECNLRDTPSRFMNPDRFRSILPDNVEYWPEVENYPYGRYAKSAKFTFLQMFSLLMNGFNHHALNIFDMFDQSFEEYEVFINLLENQKSFLNSLASLIPEGSKPYGLKACVNKNALLVRRSKTDYTGGRNLADILPNLGFPLTHSGNSPWQVLCGDDILAFNEDELNAILEKGALMDVTAAEALALRGQEQRIGVKVGEIIASDDLGYEEFNCQEKNRKQGIRFPLRAFVKSNDWKKLIPIGKKVTPTSVVKNYQQNKVGYGMVLSENDKNERFAILAFSQNSGRQLMENALRAQQIYSAVKWVSKEVLPIVISPKNPYIWPIVNRTIDNRWAIGVINISTDNLNNLEVIFDRKISINNCKVLNPNGSFNKVKIDILKRDEDEILCCINYSFEPLGHAVFFMG